MSRRKTPIRQVWHRPTYRVSRKQIPEEWTNHRFVHDSLLLCATANIPSPIMLISFIHLFFSSNIFTILLNYEKKLSSPKGKEISTKRLRRFFSFFFLFLSRDPIEWDSNEHDTRAINAYMTSILSARIFLIDRESSVNRHTLLKYR